MLSEIHSEMKPEIERMIHAHEWKALARAVAEWQPPEIADLMEELQKEDRILLYRALPRRLAAEVFSHIDSEHQDSLIRELADEDARHLLANLSPDDRTALLEELPAKITQRLFRLLNPEDLREARQLLGYPEESIGRLMTPDYISVRPEMTCAEALEHIRKTGRDSEIFNIVYVCDENEKLIDVVRLRRIILASPETRVSDMLNHRFVSLSAFDDRERAVEMIQRYDVNALPVVDSDGVLLGIVTVDDILDVAEEEATEDIQKGAAVAPLEMPYSVASPAFLFRKRIGWLVILIFVNLISAAVIASYEDYLLEFIILAFFMPLLIASGGNTGAQSATLMVRALATGDLKLNRWWRALIKELLTGVLLGVVMGGLTYLLGFYRYSSMDGTMAANAIGMIVGLSMMAIVIVANLFGVILPFALTRFKMDPAVASSPLITSLMDAIGLLIYFSIAAAILGNLAV